MKAAKLTTRGVCVVCSKEVAMNKSTRRLRVHKTKHRGWSEMCPGSGLPPKGAS